MSFLLAGLRGYDVQAHLFQRRQPATSYPEQTRSPLQQQNPNFMTVVALSVGLVSRRLLLVNIVACIPWLPGILLTLCIVQKLTSLCSRLASTVCDQLTKDAAWVRQAACSFRQQSGWLSRRPLHQVKDDKHDQQHQRQQQAEQQVSKKEQLAAQLLQAQSMLQTHRPDKELIRVIKSLGDSNIPLDTKWLEFTQRLASHGHDAIRSASYPALSHCPAADCMGSMRSTKHTVHTL